MEIKNEITLEESLRLAGLQSYKLDYLDANEDSESESKAFGLGADSKKISKKRTKYQRIDDSLRQKLIDAVVKDGQMLKAAAKKFKINYSSAKSIFHTFRKEGRVNKKAVRERYVKTSFVSPSSAKSLKQVRKSSISELKASLKTTESSSVFLPIPTPTDLKAAQIKPYLMDPLPTIQANTILSQVDKMTSQSSEYQLNNPHSLQSYRLMQNILQQSANLRLLQEFTKLQSMVPATLPLLAGKQQLGAGQSPYVNIQPPMMGLQTAPIGLGGLNLQFNGLQGYPAMGGLYPVGTGKCREVLIGMNYDVLWKDGR